MQKKKRNYNLIPSPLQNMLAEVPVAVARFPIMFPELLKT
jgi:hypothetical protein